VSPMPKGAEAMNKHLKVHFSSARQDWGTPPQFIDWIRRRWGVEFDLDVAASDDTTKAPRWFTVEDDGLSKNWFGTCWVNPPFGVELVKFISKAVSELRREEGPEEVWVLVPARTCTKWFHDLVVPAAARIFFIRGRFCFVAGEGKIAAEGANSPFPSILIMMDRESVDGASSAILSTLDVPRKIRGFKTEEPGRNPTLEEWC
jgi:phage N-6-adenine-methyltransferase